MQENVFYFMKLVSAIFHPDIMYPFVFLLAAILFIYKKREWDIILLSSSAITMSVVYVLKVLINKPRPENMLIAESVGKAFPSGHSAIAAVFTVLVIYYISTHVKKASQKKSFLAKSKNLVYVFVFALFLLIPISRLYLHVHDIYDVTAGYGIGLIVTTFCVKYSHRFFKRKDY
jgi:undecaprenyl-diphosphatase